MPFGADLLENGGVRFRLWAPSCPRVSLEIFDDAGDMRSTVPMTALDGGWHEHVDPGARAGTRYRFGVREGVSVPDPASRANPGDVHGPSEVIDPRTYQWQHAGWRGRPWHTAVVYELHVGTFTPEGDLDAARERLPQLAELGITAVQLMPLAEFAGARGWGYDGVLPFAIEGAYGRPDALKHFVDTAHGLGLMVLLDVVYNHFGPEGNHLSHWCPEFFNPVHSTPWGSAINFDAPRSEVVRRFFVENALYWVEEYGLDGLRLDAVHAIRDDSAQHIVAEIAAALRDGPGQHRAVHLVLENDDNAASLLQRNAHGAPLAATAQWNDDLHHAAHVLATRETVGYYA
ncbi:MAG: malto-oligosyltrehalose trehalohydrolase, partial [Rhizobiales bacterium]|nr:malto-oligosyltrehalose trehalohydrolase [Rhizobacter sp.]